MYTEFNLVFKTPLIVCGERYSKILQRYTEVFEKAESFSEEQRSMLNKFNELYGKYKHKKEQSDYIRYILNDKEVDFFEVFDFLEPYDSMLDIQMYFERKYESADYDNATAYILKFPKKCYFYDDWPDEEFYPQNNTCCRCKMEANDFKEKLYIKPNDGVGKLLKEKIGGVSTDAMEPIVSIQLYEKLIEYGLDENLFREVFSKKEKVLGYKFYCPNNILPSLSVNNMEFLRKAVCPECGRILFNSSVSYGSDQRVLHRRFKHVYGKNGYPLHDDRVLINADGVKALKEVNWTNEFFFGNRYVIVNKDLFNFLIKQIPRIKKSCIPVFYDESTFRYTGWAIPRKREELIRTSSKGLRMPFKPYKNEG